jgi:hypothetical protein
MIAYLFNLIIGQFCKHKWGIFDESVRLGECGDRVGMNYRLQCGKCGNMKKVEL